MTKTSAYKPKDAVLALASKLFDMARQGDSATLQAYLKAGAPADLTDAEGDSLIMLAAYHGHADTVRVLLAQGADPNRVNDRGQSPLAGAVFKGSADVVRVLLDGGADADLGKPSALETARMFDRTDLFSARH